MKKNPRPTTTYIFIFEDGTVNVSHHPPTNIDRASINDGVLQVLVTESNVGEVLEDNSVGELPECKLTGRKGERYHIHGGNP